MHYVAVPVTPLPKMSVFDFVIDDEDSPKPCKSSGTVDHDSDEERGDETRSA